MTSTSNLLRHAAALLTEDAEDERRTAAKLRERAAFVVAHQEAEGEVT